MSKTSTLAKSNSTSSLCTSDKCNVDEPLSCIVKTGSNGSILSSPSNEMFHKNNSFDKNNCSNILDGNDSITTQTDRSSGNSTSQLGYNENWGWFDDEQISDSSDVLTPLPSEENEAKGKRKEKDRTKIKKGGLLEFAHSELKPLDTVHKGSGKLIVTAVLVPFLTRDHGEGDWPQYRFYHPFKVDCYLIFFNFSCCFVLHRVFRDGSYSAYIRSRRKPFKSKSLERNCRKSASTTC